MRCPYCRIRDVSSGDHIIPAFLGGHQTVPACRQCNSSFGGSFEGRLHRALAPMQVILATNGFPLPNADLAWRAAYKDPSDGTTYDLHPGLRMRPSRISLIPLLGGGYRIIGSDKDTVRKVGKGFAAAGKARYPVEPTSMKRELPLRAARFSIPLSADMRRLAVKCCIALLARGGRDHLVQEDTLAWLRDEGGNEPDIRVVYAPPRAFEVSGRPSHHIAVEARDDSRELVGVFRIFDALSMYVRLAVDLDQPAFSQYVRLDMSDLSEHFSDVAQLGLQMPPTRVLRFVMAHDHIRSMQFLDRFAEVNFGSVRIRMAPSWIEANLMLRQ
jgi:hypothetical protein